MSENSPSELTGQAGRPRQSGSPASAKREQIFQSALKLFNSQGFHRTSVDAIAADAGSTKMTLYAHFKTKENLILDVLERRGREFRKEMFEVAAQRAKPGEDRILALFDVLGDWFTRADFSGSLFTSAAAEFNGLDPTIQEAVARHKASFHGELVSFCREAAAENPDELADQLEFLIEGAILRAQMRRGREAAKLARQSAVVLIAAARPSIPA